MWLNTFKNLKFHNKRFTVEKEKGEFGILREKCPETCQEETQESAFYKNEMTNVEQSMCVCNK